MATLLAVAAGAWSTPEAALVQAEAPDPGGLAPGVEGSGRVRAGGPAGGVELAGGAWAWPTRPDLGELWLAPAAAWALGAATGPFARGEGHVRLAYFPAAPAAGNLRAAGEVGAGWRGEQGELGLRVDAVERAWPGEASWSVGGASLGPTARWAGEGVTVAGWAAAQANHAVALDPFGLASIARGHQGRAGGEVAGEVGPVGLTGGYSVVIAVGGAPELAARPAFTLAGEVEPDVDLASGGGFVSHRAELGASLDAGGGWCFGADARGYARGAIEGVVVGRARRDLRGRVAAEVRGGARSGAGAFGWVALSWGEESGCR